MRPESNPTTIASQPPVRQDPPVQEEAVDSIYVAPNWKLVWWRFRKHKLAVASTFVVILIAIVAIAPGFFLPAQNRFLLLNEESGKWTPRGQQILDHTPMGIFGDPEDLIGTVFWLLSPSAKFVHGVVVPIDGGFSAYSGV